MTSPATVKKKALDGIRVLDFTWVAAGPTATKLLSANGAQVIKLESQRRVDIVRVQEPKTGDASSVNSSLYFNNLNTDKYSILLDLNTSKGLALAKRLVRISDVVVTNFSPNAIDKWGLDYESLAKIKEDIIVIHMPVMGMTGPKRSYAGAGGGIKALAGLNTMMGFKGSIPVGPQGTYPDFGLNPCHCIIACLSALHYHSKTGRGQFVDLSQYESVLHATGTAILDYTANDRLPTLLGNGHLQMAPHGAYRCRGDDRWIAIAVRNDEEWWAFCEVAKQPQWSKDPRFSTVRLRVENVKALDGLVDRWTIGKIAEEVTLELQAAGISAYVVQTVEDLFEKDEQMSFREHYVWVDHPEIGKVPVDSPAFRFSTLSTRPERSAPCMGEHNDLIFHDILGMSLDEINALIVEEVLY